MSVNTAYYTTICASYGNKKKTILVVKKEPRMVLGNKMLMSDN